MEATMVDLMEEKKAKWINTAKWTYWAVTLLFVVTMLSAGLTYLAGASFNVEGITHLGYPVYLLKRKNFVALGCATRFWLSTTIKLIHNHEALAEVRAQP